MSEMINCNNCVGSRRLACERMFSGSAEIVTDEFDIETRKGTAPEVLLDVAPILRQGMEESLEKNLGQIGCELNRDQIASKINERL